MKTTIDKGGRVVIPKSIRDRHNLEPGTELDIVDNGDSIELLLPDNREPAVLIEEDGFLVIAAGSGPPITVEEDRALRDSFYEARDERLD
ncbi:MAG TPA: AbrB/MazE/SpoVT family DNA-binding domain-containing protein [Acidimicrobiales bacterium]|jgi:AbrB family looped-hinge helix DNA binding protein